MEAFQCDAFAYLTKPYNSYELRFALRHSADAQRLASKVALVEGDLSASEERFRTVVGITQDVVVLADPLHECGEDYLPDDTRRTVSDGSSKSVADAARCPSRHVGLDHHGYQPPALCRPQEAGGDPSITEPSGVVRTFETELICRDGDVISVSVNARAVRDFHGTLLYHGGTVEDISERKRLAADLLEEIKIAEVARALGDIGHDVKNMLMPVLTGVDLLREEIQEILGRWPQVGEERRSK